MQTTVTRNSMPPLGNSSWQIILCKPCNVLQLDHSWSSCAMILCYLEDEIKTSWSTLGMVESTMSLCPNCLQSVLYQFCIFCTKPLRKGVHMCSHLIELPDLLYNLTILARPCNTSQHDIVSLLYTFVVLVTNPSEFIRPTLFT